METYNRLHQFKLIKSTIFVYITKSSIFVECKAAQDIQYSVSLGHKQIEKMNSVFENLVEPLHLFITGAAGIGKSHLVKILTSFLTKMFNLYSGTPVK